MSSRKLTMGLSGVGNDIPTQVGKSRPTLTEQGDENQLIPQEVFSKPRCYGAEQS